MVPSDFEHRGKGRPSKGYVSKVCSFAIRQDIYNKLDTRKNKTEVVNEALEIFFDLDGQSSQWLLERKEQIKRELRSIDSTLELKGKRELDNKVRLEQEKLKEKAISEIYRLAGDRTEVYGDRDKSTLKIWSETRLKRAGVTFYEFLKFCTVKKGGG